jgi:hypothetical protein
MKLAAKTRLMECAGETVAVFRDGCVRYTDGKPVKAAGETFSVVGNVQPLGGRDLLMVPEGDRYKEQMWIFTPFRLLINDIVTRCGVNFQIQSVEDWSSFVKARMTRVDVGPKATP